MGAIGTGFPCALTIVRAAKFMQGSGTSCCGDVGVRSRCCLKCESGVTALVIARSESDDAIYWPASCEMDCFASLAMTKEGYSKLPHAMSRHRLFQQRLRFYHIRLTALFPRRSLVGILPDHLETGKGKTGLPVEPARDAEVLTIRHEWHLPETNFAVREQVVADVSVGKNLRPSETWSRT
jgi:hypothetical protein